MTEKRGLVLGPDLAKEAAREYRDKLDTARAKSDALLERCGCKQEKTDEFDRVWWLLPNGNVARLHPYESIDDAVRLAEAMGLKVLDSHVGPDGTYIYWLRTPEREKICGKRFAPTIAEAIAEAIKCSTA